MDAVGRRPELFETDGHLVLVTYGGIWEMDFRSSDKAHFQVFRRQVVMTNPVNVRATKHGIFGPSPILEVKITKIVLKRSAIREWRFDRNA